MSHSLRSAWIEITRFTYPVRDLFKSHSLRSAWIEIAVETINTSITSMSHSLRSAWIEIALVIALVGTVGRVALLTECVDRNLLAAIRQRYHVSRTPYGVRG